MDVRPTADQVLGLQVGVQDAVDRTISLEDEVPGRHRVLIPLQVYADRKTFQPGIAWRSWEGLTLMPERQPDNVVPVRHAAPNLPGLVGERGPMVYGLCRRLADDPDDAYQTVWEKVVGAWSRFVPARGGSLGGWIATNTRRVLVDRHRRRQVRGLPEAVEPLADPGPDPERRAA